jgi:hypothetical protein
MQRFEQVAVGLPQAGGCRYLELQGAFSIALRAPGAALLRKFGFLAGLGALEIASEVVIRSTLREGTGLQRWVTEDPRPETGTDSSPFRLILFLG